MHRMKNSLIWILQHHAVWMRTTVTHRVEPEKVSSKKSVNLLTGFTSSFTIYTCLGLLSKSKRWSQCYSWCNSRSGCSSYYIEGIIVWYSSLHSLLFSILSWLVFLYLVMLLYEVQTEATTNLFKPARHACVCV